MRLQQLGTQYKVLDRYTGGCASCPRKLIEFVPSSLLDTETIFVGKSPGISDVKEQEPFTGQSGILLRQKLRDWTGLKDGTYSMTNLIKCRPFKKAEFIGGPRPNKDPTVKEISCCMAQYTIDEVEGYPYVVLLGSEAINTFFPGARPHNMRGNLVYHPDYPGQRFYCMAHPAWALMQFGLSAAGKSSIKTRDSDEYLNWKESFLRLGRILRGEEIMEGYNDWTILDLDSDQFMEKLAEVMLYPAWSFDIETTGFSWHEGARITNFALTWDGQSVISAHESEPHFEDALRASIPWFESPTNMAIGQHIGFDLDWMERTFDFTSMVRVHDTGILYNRAFGFKQPGLKYLVSAMRDGYRHMVYRPGECEDADLLRQYNAEDVIHPWWLARDGMAELEKLTAAYKPQRERRSPRDLYLQVAAPTDVFLQRVQATGILFNFAAWEQTRDELLAKRIELIHAWAEDDDHYRFWRRKSDNQFEGLESKQVLFAEYLYDKHGWPVVKTTGKGGRSTDQDALTQLMQDHGAEVLQYALDLSEIDKLLNTYVMGYPEKYVEKDGRVHPGFHITRVDTGRLSSSNPNTQNIPRDDRIRRFFMAPPGYVILESDFSQIELRVMLSLCEDQPAIDFYNAGKDAHALTAMAMTGKDTYTKEERTLAKPVNFALLYGGEFYTLMRYARTAYNRIFREEEAKRYTRKFFKQYATLREYHESITRELIANRGMVQTVVGHIHHYAGYADAHAQRDFDKQAKRKAAHYERAAINTQGQGTAAYMTNLTAILFQRELGGRGLLREISIVNTVHDSVMMQVREDLVAEAVECMELAKVQVEDWCRRGIVPEHFLATGLQPQWFHTKLVLDHAVGPTWGDLEVV